MDSFALSVRREIDAALEVRLGQAMHILLQALREAYNAVLIVKGGNAVNSLNYETKRTERMLEAVFGPGEAAKYLAYLEFGERGTGGGTGLYARSKAPRVMWLYQWLRKSGIPTPQAFITRAQANRARSASKRRHPKFDAKRDAPWNSTDPSILFAFAIAQRRKKFGRPPLRVLERTVYAQTARLQSILNS